MTDEKLSKAIAEMSEQDFWHLLSQIADNMEQLAGSTAASVAVHAAFNDYDSAAQAFRNACAFKITAASIKNAVEQQLIRTGQVL